MKRLQNEKAPKSAGNKHNLSIFEYGAIVAFVAVSLFVSTHIVEAGGFSALNAMSLNAVVNTDLGGDSTLKAD